MRERAHSGNDQFGAGLDELTPPKVAPLESPKPPTEPVKRGRGRPRKEKVVTVAEALADNPVVQAVIQPLTDGSPAAEAFRKQREREQAVEPSERSPKGIIAAREAERKPRMIDGNRVNPRTPHGFREEIVTLDRITVNKSIDNDGVARTVSIQFPDDNRPDRDEKDILEAVNKPGQKIRNNNPFTWEPGRRQWERVDPELPGANLEDAKRIARAISELRTAGIAR